MLSVYSRIHEDEQMATHRTLIASGGPGRSKYPPLSPALRSDPMTLSWTSRRKQIGGLSGSRLLGPFHEQIDRGGTVGTGCPW